MDSIFSDKKEQILKTGPIGLPLRLRYVSIATLGNKNYQEAVEKYTGDQFVGKSVGLEALCGNIFCLRFQTDEYLELVPCDDFDSRFICPLGNGDNQLTPHLLEPRKYWGHLVQEVRNETMRIFLRFGNDNIFKITKEIYQIPEDVFEHSPCYRSEKSRVELVEMERLLMILKEVK